MAAHYKPLGQALEDFEEEENAKVFEFEDVHDERGRTLASVQERVALFLRGGTLIRDVYNSVQIAARCA
jgi:hypothetical protein